MAFSSHTKQCITLRQPHPAPQLSRANYVFCRPSYDARPKRARPSHPYRTPVLEKVRKKRKSNKPRGRLHQGDTCAGKSKKRKEKTAQAKGLLASRRH
eukprot:1157859-Pelagomonas_calceolata.AAC.3